MQISVTGTHIEIGSAFTNHIETRTQEIIGKYFEYPIDVHVTISKENHGIEADIFAHVGKGIDIRGNAQNGDPYQTFDEALHKLEASLRRYKSRLKSHHSKHQQKNKQALQYILSSEYRNLEATAVDEPLNPTIVAEIQQEIPHLSASEAVMRMDLADAPVYVFYNSAHGGLNVVYFRKDGNIGWIDPDGIKKAKKI